MWAKRWVSWLGLSSFAACGQPPAPTQASHVAAPARARPHPAPSASASSAAPPASSQTVAVEPPPPRWTTPPDSDTCVELTPRAYSDFTKFPSKQECEAWVAARSCRPGFTCFDGCNWRTCDYRGAGVDMTLAGCSSGIVRVSFERGTTNYSDSVEWATWVDAIEERIKAPARQLSVRGYAMPDEAKDAAAVTRLAKARAEVVARDLVSHGIPRKRMILDVGSMDAFSPNVVERSLVDVGVSPDHPIRDDFEPNSIEYRLFCGARPQK